jgi:hypothetical protein
MMCDNNGTCGTGTCLPPGSNCQTSPQCCTGLVCTSGHCGIAPPDSGACPLDPGGTPCSQCIVGACCNETVACLNDAQCAMSMACYQECTVGGKPPAQCKQSCCTGTNCNTWTTCVAGSCAAKCF